MYHAIVHDHFVKDKAFFHENPIIGQKADQCLIMNIVKVGNPKKFAEKLQKAMIDAPYCSPMYGLDGDVVMVFKDITCSIDPQNEGIWEEATDYISEITKTPSWHNYCYPKKISEEYQWLHTNNEIEKIAS
jgi:hypothetical protein